MPLAPPGTRWHEEVDIGIVGAGACGLAAAHACAADDVRVVVWERARVAGGASATGDGMIAAAGTRLQRAAGIDDSPEDFYGDIMARNGGTSDADLTRHLCNTSANLIEWLVDSHRVDLELVRQTRDPGHRRPRLHAPASRSGQALIDGLLASSHRRGLEIRLATPVLQLWFTAEGAVAGVQLRLPKKSPTNVRCAALILANGGFAADSTLLAEHCHAAAGLTYAGAPTSTGAALRWGMEIGAAARDLAAYHAHPAVAVGSNLPVPWTLIGNGAIIVNQRGERFADETMNPGALVQPVLEQPGRLAYVILDARILHVVSAEDPHFATHVAARVLRRADDLAGLAAQFQIDAAGLTATVQAYNDTAGSAGDVRGPSESRAPLAPPFYAIRVSPALLATQGGLRIDTAARVLRPDGTPFPGLYAGGGSAVGLSGAAAEGYLLGTDLLCALGWGRVAGEHAARTVALTRPTTAASAPDTSVKPPPAAPEDESTT
jgi:fumarate reductase flavoprotein subunit